MRGEMRPSDGTSFGQSRRNDAQRDGRSVIGRRPDL